MLFSLLLQVPLGVLLRNENKIDEMVDILETLQKYVPMKRTTEQFSVAGEKDVSVQVDHFLHLLF